MQEQGVATSREDLTSFTATNGVERQLCNTQQPSIMSIDTDLPVGILKICLASDVL